MHIFTCIETFVINMISQLQHENQKSYWTERQIVNHCPISHDCILSAKWSQIAPIFLRPCLYKHLGRHGLLMMEIQ